MKRQVDRQKVDESGSPQLVGIGTRVEVDLLGEDGNAERLAFDLVPGSQADFGAGFLGAGTPLAQTILGHPAGDSLPYRMADILQVRITKVAPSERRPSSEAASRRQAVIDAAVRKSELDDVMRLALTVNVKWGDYDPEGLESHW